jgi:TonB-dependent receptor
MYLKNILLTISAFFILSGNLFAYSTDSTSESEEGTFQALTFKDGLPSAGVEVILDGKHRLVSSSDDSLFKGLKEGRHFLEIKKGEEIQSVSFIINKGETTQVLINTFSADDAPMNTDISEPDAVVKKTNDGPKGTLSGVVLNDENKPVAGAKLFVAGVSESIQTNGKGEFSLSVPEGRYNFSVLHKLYSTQTIKNKTVMPGKVTSVNIKMLPTGLELEEFIVVAPHVKGSLASLIEVRRKASTVADVLGAEQMSKSGDSNAAASLARVTGLTVVDGRFVYIRGLGERYSNVLLNGTSLPSPDPTRRVVQLDLFPSGILESMVIQKSYSPNLPGSFGGGAVNLKTKDIPDEFTAKVTLSTSYESGQANIETSEGGSRDWLGMDDGSRELPAAIREATANGQRISNDDPNTTAYGLAFKRNYRTFNKKTTLPPGMSLSIGDTLRYRGKKFGFNVAGLYADRYSNDDITRQDFDVTSSESSELTKVGDRTNSRSRRDINLSGMLNLGMDLGRGADIRANTLILRKTSDRVEKRTNTTQDNEFEGTYVEWQERQLLSQIVNGTHKLGKNTLSWRGSYSKAEMIQPDSHYYQLLVDEGQPRFDNQGRSNERVFGNVEDVVREGEASFEIPLMDSNNFKFKSILGAGRTEKKRESRFQRFKYEVDTQAAVGITGDSSILGQSPDEICTDEVIRQGACKLVDTTVPSDRFEAQQSVQSYFLETQSEVMKKLKVNLGVRFEDSRQDITTYEGVNLTPVNNSLLMQDFLPAAGLTYFLTDKMQMRLGYSETISRPAFKDLNPVGYFDDERDRTVNGNANLKGTIIRNLDARLEWYFGNQENVSLGFFSKEFLNPIEEVAGSFQNGVLTYSEGGFQLANVGNATARGFEVEFRKNFGFLGNALEPLAIGGNYARIDSEMTIFDSLAAQVTNTSRALQGQSPYVINLNLDYDNKDIGTNVTLLFNVFGARIDTVGTDRRPDTYQESFNQLDFVMSQTFGKDKKNKVRFKMQNILDPDAVLTLGGEIRETYKKGRRASLSYTRTF